MIFIFISLSYSSKFRTLKIKIIKNTEKKSKISKNSRKKMISILFNSKKKKNGCLILPYLDRSYDRIPQNMNDIYRS